MKLVYSYTTFQYSEATLSTNKVKANQAFEVSVTISNTGKLAGRETVQFYVHDVKSSLQRPPKELKAFTKTKLLEPGTSETVKVSLDHISLGYFDDHVDVNKWIAEKGAFKVYIGPTSEEVSVELDFELTETYSWI
jgi:beta-glucosidase